MSVPEREPEGAFTPAELSIMAKAIDAAEVALDLSEDSAPELTRLRIAAIVLETFQAGERDWQALAEGALAALKPVLRGYASMFPPGGSVASAK